jgi:hypothetical protein
VTVKNFDDPAGLIAALAKDGINVQIYHQDNIPAKIVQNRQRSLREPHLQLDGPAGRVVHLVHDREQPVPDMPDAVPPGPPDDVVQLRRRLVRRGLASSDSLHDSS